MSASGWGEQAPAMWDPDTHERYPIVRAGEMFLRLEGDRLRRTLAEVEQMFLRLYGIAPHRAMVPHWASQMLELYMPELAFEFPWLDAPCVSGNSCRWMITAGGHQAMFVDFSPSSAILAENTEAL